MSRLPFFWRWVVCYISLGIVGFVLFKLFGWEHPSPEIGAVIALVLTIDAERDAA